MKRTSLLQLIAAAVLILLPGAHPVLAADEPAVQAPAPFVVSSPAEPIRLAWDRVGAAA